MMINIIVAAASNGAIGCQGRLPWHLPEDMKHFKALTWGRPIIMGRKTAESLPNGALPGRRNIVLSKKCAVDNGLLSNLHSKGFEVVSSLDDALKAFAIDEDVFVIGGETVYRQALPLADNIFLTLVDEAPKAADAFFPPFDKSEWRETKKEKHDGFSFVELTRIS